MLLWWVLTILAAAPGCATLNALIGGVGKPSASLVGARLDALTADSVTLVFDVAVSNPYTVDLPLTNLEYGLSSKGKEFLSGKANVEGSVPAKGSRTLPVPARIEFGDLLNVLEGVRPGSVVPYAARLALSVDLPGGGTLALPLSKEGEVPVPTIPEVTLEGVELGSITPENVAAVFKVRIKNRNEFPVDLSKLSYGLVLGTATIARSSIEDAVSFTPGGERTIALHTSFSPKDLGLPAIRMLSGTSSSYKIGGTMSFKTPFGLMELPYERSGRTSLAK
jgi:LEA14-like dessication related protein